MINKATIALTSLAASFPIFAEPSIATKVGVEAWVADTKVNEVRRDTSVTGTLYVAVEHQVNYGPNVRLRYSSVDADYMGFDKLDLTLYYQVLEHDLLHFDAGVTVSRLSETYYVDATASRKEEFDDVIWAWFGYAEVTVPNTNLDVIGEMNFGDSQGIKNTDLMAGLQYNVPLDEARVTFRGGYRVIDLESEQFLSSLGKEFMLADGVFLSAEYSF